MSRCPHDEISFRTIEPRGSDIAVGDRRPPGGAYEVFLNGTALGVVRRRSEESRRTWRDVRYSGGILGYPRTWYAETWSMPTVPERALGGPWSSRWHRTRRSAVEALWDYIYG